MTFGQNVAAFQRALGRRHGFVFFLVDKYVVMFEAPEAALLRGSQFSPPGEFDHIVWVTMTKDGPRIANLMLDGIYDENVRVAR